MNLVFLGPPGSGKGTQSALLSQELAIPTISTGDALRAEVEKKSQVGNMAQQYMTSGKLVPDEVVIEIIKNRIVLDDCKKGFILDGFPRNVEQGVALNEMFDSLQLKLDVVFLFEVDEGILIKRISGRFVCGNCKEVYNKFFKKTNKDGICDKCGSTKFETRADDNEETVRNRLRVYNDTTKSLVEYYQKKDLIYSVDALKSVDSIFQGLIAKVKSL